MLLNFKYTNQKEVKSNYSSNLQNKKNDLIKKILEKNISNYNNKSNLRFFNIEELESIFEQEHHLAYTHKDQKVYDLRQTSFIKDRNTGKVNVSHRPLDIKFQEIQNLEIGKFLGGTSAVYNLRTAHKIQLQNTSTSGISLNFAEGMERRIKQIIYRISPKYTSVVNYIFQEQVMSELIHQLHENLYGLHRKLLVKFLLCVIKELSSKFSISTSIKELSYEMGVDTKGYYPLIELVGQLTFIKKHKNTNMPNRRLGIDSDIYSAKNILFRLADFGFIDFPVAMNSFLDEIENHYPQVINIRLKRPEVFALVTLRLFNYDLEVASLVDAVYRTELLSMGLTDIEPDRDLISKTRQVFYHLFRKDSALYEDARTGKIASMFEPEFSEFNPPQDEIVDCQILLNGYNEIKSGLKTIETISELVSHFIIDESDFDFNKIQQIKGIAKFSRNFSMQRYLLATLFILIRLNFNHQRTLLTYRDTYWFKSYNKKDG